jgi:hypothetical protein
MVKEYSGIPGNDKPYKLHESVKASPGGLGIQTQCVDPQKLGSSA